MSLTPRRKTSPETKMPLWFGPSFEESSPFGKYYIIFDNSEFQLNESMTIISLTGFESGHNSSTVINQTMQSCYTIAVFKR